MWQLEEIQRQKLADLATAIDRLVIAEEFYDEKKAETKYEKEDYEACRDQVTSISKDLRDIERGVFQPELPFEGPGRETSATVTITTKDLRKLDKVQEKLKAAQ